MDAIMKLFAEDKIAVIWDIDQCKVPDGKSYGDVAENVKKSLRDCGLTGEISMMAYGVTSPVKAELLLAGITPIVEQNNVEPNPGSSVEPDQGDSVEPDQGYYSVETNPLNRVKSFLEELWLWVVDHGDEPWNLLLIVGDKSDQHEFVRCLFVFKGRNFNVLLSLPPSAKGPLLDAGQRVWDWPALAVGGSPVSESECEARSSQDVEFLDYSVVCFSS